MFILAHRWEGRFIGPGSFKFAVPGCEQVLVFTDHSCFLLFNNGTPNESVILDSPVVDAVCAGSDTFILQDEDIRQF